MLHKAVMSNQPISCHWSLSIPMNISENQRFPDVSRGIERDQWHKGVKTLD